MLTKSAIKHAADIFFKYKYLRICFDPGLGLGLGFNAVKPFKDDAYDIITEILERDCKTNYVLYDISYDRRFFINNFDNVTCYTDSASHINHKGYKNIITDKNLKYRKGFKIICICYGLNSTNPYDVFIENLRKGDLFVPVQPPKKEAAMITQSDIANSILNVQEFPQAEGLKAYWDGTLSTATDEESVKRFAALVGFSEENNKKAEKIREPEPFEFIILD